MASIGLSAPRTYTATDFLILRWLWNVVKASKLRQMVLRWVWVGLALVLTTEIPSRGSASQNPEGNSSVPHYIVDAFRSDAKLWETYLFWGQLAAALIWFFVAWRKNLLLTVLFVELFKPHWLITCVCYGIAFLNHFYSKLAPVQAAFWLLCGLLASLSSKRAPPFPKLLQIAMTTAAVVTGVAVACGCGDNRIVDRDGTVLLLGLCFTWDSFKIVDTYGRLIAGSRGRTR
ncbi:uncharacterized protein LOC131206153 [Anopheles bellator]|uniref:uncharacterized protein LOC131206153 n=1 Tax=Anopheles bellator TaxID=139047 RepID=UPI0026470D8E|nr:uncharacterized protein LOC131206153 [Anopheles bellator]